jgi:hypothetical protein
MIFFIYNFTKTIKSIRFNRTLILNILFFCNTRNKLTFNKLTFNLIIWVFDILFYYRFY